MSDYYREDCSDLPLFNKPTGGGNITAKYGKGKAGKLLQVLADGQWHHTTELVERVTHRFSACKTYLKHQGHVIEKRPCRDGRKMYEWRYVKKIKVKRVTETMQEAYYLSSHWRSKRKERLAFDGNRCVMCHETNDLHVHHWHYDLFEEDVTDLMTLCSQCHAWIHETLTIAFPKSIDEVMLDRLRAEWKQSQS